MQSVAVLGYLETFSAVVLSAVLLREGMSLLRLLGVGCILGGAMLAEWEKDKVLLFRIKEAVKHSLVSPLLFVQAPFST